MPGISRQPTMQGMLRLLPLTPRMPSLPLEVVERETLLGPLLQSGCCCRKGFESLFGEALDMFSNLFSSLS